MEPVNLSILVVNCKQYIPTYNWYFCKSNIEAAYGIYRKEWRTGYSSGGGDNS